MIEANALAQYKGDPAAFLHKYGKEFGLLLYERMSQAIRQCGRVDEVKKIRHKARAIEVYAAQARNHEAEDTARKIRLRAERRCGELLRESPKNPGAKGNPKGRGGKIVRSNDKTAQPTLGELGISKQQSSDWQKLAAIPEKEFERQLNRTDTGGPSTHELIVDPKPVTMKVSKNAVFVHGRIYDFEFHRCMELDPRELYDNMLDTMQAEIDEILPRLIPWLKRLNRKGTS